MSITSQKIADKTMLNKLNKIIEQYKFLTEKIKEYEQMKELMFNGIVDIYEQYGIDKHKGVRLEHKSYSPKISLKALRNEFNNQESSLLDVFVVDLDIESTINNLYYVKNLSKPIINAIETKLENLKDYKTKRLVIEKE